MDAEAHLVVAAVQLSSQDDVESNLEDCRSLVRVAVERGARVVVLPENFAYLGPETGKRRIAERLGDAEAPIQQTLATLAKAHGIAIVAGGMPEKSEDPNRPFNTCAVFDSSGSIVARYRKIHLFDVDLPDGSSLRESEATAAGTEPIIAEIHGFRFGLSVCYDLRFPELYRRLVERGADVLVVPAAFTLLTGKDHWHVLLRARAIENQCWVIAAAQIGRHPKGRSTYGHTLVVDPWGTIVTESSDRVGVISAEIDRSELARVRDALPCLKHRVL